MPGDARLGAGGRGWHAIYMTEHASALTGHSDCFVDGHHEKPGCTFFSGVTPNDQLVANGMPSGYEMTGQDTGDAIACRLGANDFIAGMLAAPFHRGAMMDPDTSAGGFATMFQNHLEIETWANTITMAGPVGGRSDRPEVVVYPQPGDKDVPRHFTGIETPQPPEPPTGWPSGYPVSIFGRRGIEWTGAALCRVPRSNKPGATCIHVPFMFLLNKNDRRVRPWVGHIYAYKPLLPHQIYEARFDGTRDGVPFTKEWRFTTGD